MKKIYLFIISISANVLLMAQVPTCSLDATFIAANRVGVWPDSVTNFMSGTVGQPYVQNLTVKVPRDTIAGPVNSKFCFNSFDITTANGVTNYNMPPGLTFGSSTSSVNATMVGGAPAFKMPGNANNCASIYGTPTAAGSYTLSIKVTPYLTAMPFGQCPNTPNVNGGSGSLTAPQILNYYIINIAPAIVSVNEINKNQALSLKNQPNPFSEKTNITYHVDSEEQAMLSVYNALGALVYSNKYKTTIGENMVELNAENWPNGVYIYTIKFKNSVSTNRLMVNH